jgi:hypothetical protein
MRHPGWTLVVTLAIGFGRVVDLAEIDPERHMLAA